MGRPLRGLALAAALLGAPHGARADNLLRRGGTSVNGAAEAAAAAAAQAATSQAAALQAQGQLRRSFEAVTRWRAAQEAARAAALLGPSGVPDGLAPGGLEIAPGVQWEGLQAPVVVQSAGRTEVTLVQDQAHAIASWTTFNVGRGTDVHFDQRQGGDDVRSWVALNRVLDPAARPSTILGSITAEGQVYLVNLNGIIFGGSAQVSVGALLAGGIELGTKVFEAGLASGRNAPVFLGSDGQVGGPVTVLPGAHLEVARYGQVLLLGGSGEGGAGPSVLNRGFIEAPDGQVLLAAGREVGLSPTADQRGFLPPVLAIPGGVANGAEGFISTPRGNVTMAGSEVTQDGLLSATTGAEASGSFLLGLAATSRTTFGPRSVTQILPDVGGPRVVGDGSIFVPSRATFDGASVVVEHDATVYLPAGVVEVGTSVASTAVHPDGLYETGRFYLAEGARLDVSGLPNVEVAMSQNTIQAELRAAQLQDNPVLLNGALRGRTVYFDARLGVGGVANLAGYYDLLERDVAQLMTGGGRVSLYRDQVITRAGSTIDLSGGSLHFLDGFVRSTMLLDPTGRRVPIESAEANVAYLGIAGDFDALHQRWGVTERYASGLGGTRVRFEPGYLQGGAAGTLEVGSAGRGPASDIPSPDLDLTATGQFRILEGSIAASTVAGRFQRELPSGTVDPTRSWRERPAGATLLWNRAGEVVIAAGAGPLLGAGFDESTAPDPALRYRHLLPESWFDGTSFTQVVITSGYSDDALPSLPASSPTINIAPGGTLAIGAGVRVDLGQGGQFRFTGKQVELDGTLLAPGGAVSLQALDGASLDQRAIHLGPTAVIDVAGRVSNDQLDGAAGPLQALNGGGVTLRASSLTLDPGSVVDASGGARWSAGHGAAFSLLGGTGGAIVLDVSGHPRPLGPSSNEPSAAQLHLEGSLLGFALGTGGSLELDTPFDLVLGAALPEDHSAFARLVTPELFTLGGFAHYTLVGERSLTVTAGTTVHPSVETLVLTEGASGLSTGTRLLDVPTVRREVLAGPELQAMTLRLSTVPVRGLRAPLGAPTTGPTCEALGPGGCLVLEAGSALELSRGSAITLLASGTLSVDGTVEAPAGAITLQGDDRRGGSTSLGLGDARIEVGPHARLLAAGTLDTSLDRGLVRRGVLSGGSIILAVPGLPMNQVTVAAGALLDVSGVAGMADLDALPAGPAERVRYSPTEVEGSAGSISLSAASGRLEGTLRLAPGGPTGSGGTLSVASSRMVIRQSSAAALDGSGFALVADRLDESGAGSVTLDASNAELIFDGTDGPVSLTALRALTLRSGTLGTDPLHPASVSLRSAAVTLEGARNVALARPGALVDPQATLTVEAGVIDLVGTLQLGCSGAGCSTTGFITTRLLARGDLRLSDRDLTGARSSAVPGLVSGGALELDAAQVYVSSRSTTVGASGLDRPEADDGFLLQSATSITITGPGTPTTAPLSFGERLTLRAPSITVGQGGVIRAPQGQLRLVGVTAPDGTPGTVRLLPGSLVSVSLDGATVPFGDLITQGVFPGYDTAGWAPTKSIRLDAPQVTVAAGSVVDVSGGGDLAGFTFAQGAGGSRDILAAAGTYAVLPSLGTGPVPFGRVASLRDSSLQLGDVVWLQGVAGLAAGFYTLLPARYALLPGGLLVRPLGGSFAAAPASFVQADGSVVAAGYQAELGTTARDPAFGRFLVMSREVFGRYSLLLDASFNQQAQLLAQDAGAAVRTPADAGSAVFRAQRLVLEGTGRFGGNGGLVGNLDISAPRIAVLGAGAASPGAGWLELDATALSAFGAGSVLLGGTRASGPEGTTVTVDATDVLVRTSAEAPLTGAELLLAATGTVTVADGSVLRAQGITAADPSGLSLRPRSGTQGDGTLLRLSTGQRVATSRAGASGAAGVLSLGNATLDAAGSLTLEASRGVELAPGLLLQAPQLDLTSGRVNLGDAPAGAPGARFSAALLARLAGASDLVITGSQGIHLYGDLALGRRVAGVPLPGLTLDAPLLQGEGGAIALTAGTLVLRNTAAAAIAGTTGPGTLGLDVDTLQLGPGRVELAGFQQVQGRAGALLAQGEGGLHVAGSVSLEVPWVGAAAGAHGSLQVDGSLRLTSGGATGTGTSGLGARLSLLGASVILDTVVELPAGTLRATAIAPGGALTLGAQAVLDVTGQSTSFEGQTRSAPGGSLVLSATGAGGALTVSPGAQLDVSGAAGGGAAGQVSLSAAGQLSEGGAVRGSAAEGFQGGAFSVDAASLGAGTAGDLTALASALTAGGFTTSLDLRLRAQDLVVAAGTTLTAHLVTLQADQGQVRLEGTVAAQGTSSWAAGGRVRLLGGAGVTVSGTIDAHAFSGELPAGAFTPSPASVELVASGGRLDLAPGSLVDVSGGSADGVAGGSLVLRAPRTGAEVAVDRLAGTLRGLAARPVVQGTQTYGWDVVDAPRVSQLLAEAAAWEVAAAAPIRARLGDVVVAPAMVVTTPGDLTIASAIDLHALASPGSLGFVSTGGSITVGATVSDGFDSADRVSGRLLDAESFSLGFDARGDLTVGRDVMVRTGTGNLSLRAGGTIRLLAATSVAYTAGRRTPTAAGWEAPLGVTVGEFPTGGGDLELVAGADIVAPLASQTTSAWLFRTGSVDVANRAFDVLARTSWSIVYRNFQQGVGALGGGDVSVSAGGIIDQLQVALPTTGHLTTALGAVAQSEDLVVRGGGDLRLGAGDDLLGGLFLIGRGHGELRAGGRVAGSASAALRTSANPLSSLSFSPVKVGALFGLMDATVQVTAGSTLEVEGAFDPMLQGQVAENRSGAQGTGSAFFGYTDRTSLEATALSGRLTYLNDPWASADLAAQVTTPARFRVFMTGGTSTSLNALFGQAPGTLRFTALDGDVLLTDRRQSDPNTMRLTQASASLGTLEVLASGNLWLGLSKVQMKELAPRWVPDALRPFATAFSGGAAEEGTATWTEAPDFNASRDFGVPLHAGDPDPVRLYALRGSVCATRSASCTIPTTLAPTELVFPKPLEVLAGLDIRTGLYRPQHNTPTDQSWMRAGRDIREVAFEPEGGGEALLVAGRDLVQRIVGASGPTGTGGVLVSVGNGTVTPGLPNLALSARSGTDLYVLAGAASGVDLDGFASVYLDPANSHHVPATYLTDLAGYLSDLGQPGLQGAGLLSAFRALPLARRETFLLRVYMEELKATGIDYNDPLGPRFQSYQRGFDAVARLFPTDPTDLTAQQRGDVLLTGKAVETQAEGDITILAPYGAIQVGAQSTPSGFKASEGGLVTRRGGSIRLMADQSIDLYSSRVFTLQGGDITMWTSNGSITAGTGSKTSVFQVPLSYVMNDQGEVTVNAFGLATGAGIGVLDALGDASQRRRSRLDLVAPRGEVNAGDSGIRVAGDLNIAAQVVVGVENIRSTGATAGVPRVTTPDVGALTAASQVSQAAAKEGVGPDSAAAAAEARRTLSELPSIITVEVVGYETPRDQEPGDGKAGKRKVR